MRIFDLLARILLAAAGLVLVLKLYTAIVTSTEYVGTGQTWPFRAESIAGAVQDAGILLALAGGMLALDRLPWRPSG